MTPSARTYDNVTVFRIAELETLNQGLQKENAGLRADLDRVKGLLDIFLFEGSSSGRRYGQIWKRREELRKEHGLD